MAIRHRYQTIEHGDMDIHVRSLRGKQEYPEDPAEAAAAGVPEAYWSFFGVLWESGLALSELMANYELDGRRILEVGCGLGVASLVLNERDSDITATDAHISAGDYLDVNVALNCGRPIPFVQADWAESSEELGTFGLIIGSDILFESYMVHPLADFIDRHAQPQCEVIIVDPRRGCVGRFQKRMATHGFDFNRRPAAPGQGEIPFSGEILQFVR